MLGRTFSHYQIVEPLGKGGMGAVYKARDTLLGRPVALKVLSAELGASERGRQRFFQEARAASALSHPHIVTIYDVLREDVGDLIVMEYVSGGTLAAAIPGGGLPLGQALRWAIQIAGALGAAHQAGIVHRDVKPGNVLLTGSGDVKVADFGLAKLDPILGAEADAPTLEALTQAGVIVGSRGYMSPEQAQGLAVDARSDIFSLGAVLYEMVSGVRAFDRASLVAVLHAIVYEGPSPLGEVAARLPAGLIAVLERALAKEPARRFQTMAEMAAALEAVRRDVESGLVQPSAEAVRVAAPSLPPAPPSRSWPVRSWSVGAVAALVLLVGFLLLPRTRAWLRGSLGAGAAAPTAATLPQTQFELYERGLGLLDRFDRAGYVEQASEAFQRAIAIDPAYAPASAGLALAHWRQYRSRKDPMWLQRARDTARHARQLDPQLVSARVVLGLVEVESGALDEAAALLDEALALDPANADAWRGQGDLRRARGDLAGAAEAYRKAIELAPDSWQYRLELGVVAARSGDYPAAVAALQQAAELSPDNALVYRNLGAMYHYAGRYADAAKALQRSLAIQPDGSVYSNLGTLYFFQGLYPQAVAAFERAIELGANDALLWANLGDAYRWTAGKEEPAREAFTRAIQMVREGLEAAPQDPELRSRLALYLAKRGDGAAARSELERLATRADLDAATLYRAAVAREVVGDRAAALELLRRALVAGYSLAEIRSDPEIEVLRADPRFHRMVIPFAGEPGK